MDMETFEFGQICDYLKLTHFACIRICSDVPNQNLESLKREIARSKGELLKEAAYKSKDPQRLEEGADEEDIGDEEKEPKQTCALQKLMRKLLNFAPLVIQCQGLVQRFTFHAQSCPCREIYRHYEGS